MFATEPISVGKCEGRHCCSARVTQMCCTLLAQPRGRFAIADAGALGKLARRLWLGTVSLRGRGNSRLRNAAAQPLRQIPLRNLNVSRLWSAVPCSHTSCMQQPPHVRMRRMLHRAGVQFRYRDAREHLYVLLDVKTFVHFLRRSDADFSMPTPEAALFTLWLLRFFFFGL